jgi:N-acyl-D-amino-acid deacylase
MIKLARDTGVRLQYSHLIFVGTASWKTVDESLALIDAARKDGVDIAYDLYSMTFGVSVITVVLPNWYLSLPQAKRRSPLTKLRLAAEIGITKRVLGFGFQDMQVAWVGEGNEALCGKRVPEIAEEWGVSELDAYLRLVDLSEGRGRVNMYRYYDEPTVARLPARAVTLHDRRLDRGERDAERRGLLLLPKFLGMAREGTGPSLEMAVRKMTGATADRFGIPDRGYLRAGYAADVTVFDPAEVGANGDEPVRPRGIREVYIGGRRVVSAGTADDAALGGAGAVLAPER